MARVSFSHDFDYRPTPAVTIAYKAGREYTVRRECADQAIALGRATDLQQPSRSEAAAEPISDAE
jgi:hypothetical protein